MATPPLSAEILEETRLALEKCGWNQSKAASILGVARSTLQNRALKIDRPEGQPDPENPPELEFAPIPPAMVSVEDLLAHRKQQFQQKRLHEEATKILNVKVKLEGPVGILHFGDPHVDDDGTDIFALERHAALIRNTPGLYGGNIGDLTNNWVGKLARLWANQSTSAAEGWQLAEWFIKSVDKWIYLIGGNHDLWSGTGDPLIWITRQCTAPYTSSGVRLNLQFPTGDPIRINARHDHPGHSQWNAAHGPAKTLQLGERDHIAIAGHRHISGHNTLKCPQTGITMHALRVASYKVYDNFAKERSFADQHLSPCVVTVLDPLMPDAHPDRVKVFWEPEEGADYLNFKRRSL